MKLVTLSFCREKDLPEAGGKERGGINGEANGPDSEVSTLVDNCKVYSLFQIH